MKTQNDTLSQINVGLVKTVKEVISLLLGAGLLALVVGSIFIPIWLLIGPHWPFGIAYIVIAIFCLRVYANAFPYDPKKENKARDAY